MRMLFAILVSSMAALVSGNGAVGQSYHDPVYLVGGFSPGTTLYGTGIYLLHNRGAAVSLSPLWSPAGYSHGFQMDSDNRAVIVPVTITNNQPGSGLYRFDPKSRTFSTIYWKNDPQASVSMYDAHVDQNGDYLCCTLRQDRQTPANTEWVVLKIDHQTTAVTTILRSSRISPTARFTNEMTRDVASGRVLVNVDVTQTSPTTLHYPIVAIDPDEPGSFSYWTRGSTMGWIGGWSMPQNDRTGNIEGPFGRNVYRVAPGQNRTTLATLQPLPTSNGILSDGDFDLQTAAAPRQVTTGHRFTNSGPQTFLYHVDAGTWAVTSMAVTTLRVPVSGFDFYRGRHTQSVRVSPRRWRVQLSSPRHAGRAYAIAAGLSGAAPGFPLADGRRVLLNYDPLVDLTIKGPIPGIWNPGPLTLDASGEAVATIDLSSIPRLGLPLWIAWVVIDSTAPLGIAYVPDVYVMRI